MYELRVLIGQDLKNLLKNPMWIFYNTLFPLLLIGIMGYLCEDLYGTSVRSYDYYCITFMLYSAFNSATIAANSFMEQKIKAGNMRILYSPLSASWLYRSKIIASTLFTSSLHLLDLLFLWGLLSFPIGNHPFILLALLLCVEVFANIIGIWMCCIFHRESFANQIISIVLNVAAILGGIFFSLESLGEVLGKISMCSPIKWVLDAMIEAIYDGQTHLVYVCITGLILLSLLGLYGCHRSFHVEDCL